MRKPEIGPRQEYQEFIRAQLPSSRAPIRPPATASGWDNRLAAVRQGLRRSFGSVPDQPCDLAPEILGTLTRDGYAIERLTFQSRPGVRVTANLYRPEPAQGRYPGILSVHGHWPWARIDPHVQPRCIALAKRGYVCLCVDAFGAGERAVEPAPGTYHGALLGASLWPAGVPLLGLQVYDNRRAVDYLVSRPEVDPGKLAITGASGGGNQTLYAGAIDDRFTAVVPVCGIGTYEAYIQSACCVCEVNVGGLTYATTGDLLAMIAPRALLVVNATQDALQFSVGEARKSLNYAAERYRLLGVPEKIRQAVIESGHDYNQPMREALYGWLDRWLKGRGDGSPIAEPALKTEDPATLRCYPDASSRPATVVTIPQFALREGRERLAKLPPAPDHPQRWDADAARMRAELRDLLGGFPTPCPLEPALRQEEGRTIARIVPEPGLHLEGELHGDRSRDGTVILLTVEGFRARPLRGHGYRGSWLHAELRALGAAKPETPTIVQVPDHNEAEWGLWIGRPLLGQWVWDTVRWLDALDVLASGEQRTDARWSRPYSLVGFGPMGLVALVAAAFDGRVSAVGIDRGLVSFVGEGPWSRVPMGILVPEILQVADVGQLAALVAPRRLAIGGGVEPNGSAASEARLKDAFGFTTAVYRMLKAEQELRLTTSGDLPRLLQG